MQLIDLDLDGILSGDEIINAVQDVYDLATATADYFDVGDAGLVGGTPNETSNLPHIGANDFMV